MSKKWNDDLRRRMEQYEASAPDDLFDDIMSALPAEATTTPIVRLWPRRIAIAAALAIAVATGYLMLITPMPSADDVMANTEPSVEASYLQPSAPTPEQTSVLSDATVKKTPKVHTTRPTSNEPLIEPLPEPLPESTTSIEATPSQHSKEATPQQPAAKRKNTTSRPSQQRATQPAKERVMAVTTPRGNAGRLSMGLHAAGITIGQNNHATQQVFMVSSALYGVRQDEIEDEPTTEVLLHDEEHTISSERHHRLPVRVGLTLRYNLSDRWAIESGVTYTKLSSETSLGNSANYYDERTTLHYIGLPVNAVYNIWQSRRLTVYASAGAMVEKSVSGGMRTDYFVNNDRINTLRSDVSVKPLQWSVNAAAGVQYNFSRWIAIYAEPSIGYHFDNSTKIETLYNERPLDFNLGVGLRFTLR